MNERKGGAEGTNALEEAPRLVPQGTDILICEGITNDDPKILRVVWGKCLELLKETFEVCDLDLHGQGIKKGDGDDKDEDYENREWKGAKIIALSGIMTNDVKEHPNSPVFNCMTPGGVDGLVG